MFLLIHITFFLYFSFFFSCPFVFFSYPCLTLTHKSQTHYLFLLSPNYFQHALSQCPFHGLNNFFMSFIFSSLFYRNIRQPWLQEVGIKYVSPFGAKFVIPLHPIQSWCRTTRSISTERHHLSQRNWFTACPRSHVQFLFSTHDLRMDKTSLTYSTSRHWYITTGINLGSKLYKFFIWHT